MDAAYLLRAAPIAPPFKPRAAYSCDARHFSNRNGRFARIVGAVLMGVMSQIAAEKEDEINALHWEYQEAFAALMEYQDRHPPAHRSAQETAELSRLTSICELTKYKYDTAEMRRYRL